MVVSVEGLEPSTNGLKGRCSAIELHAHHTTKISLALTAESVNKIVKIRYFFRGQFRRNRPRVLRTPLRRRIPEAHRL